MHIHIIKPGILSTVQDGGRTGCRALGIAPGGVMDVFAAAKANQLALNNHPTALIEMHYPAPELLFETDALIGIAGGDFDMHVNNIPAANWQPHIVKAGSIVSFRALNKGFRVYMAVHGGLAVAPWLGSYATHTVAQRGGFNGRPLQKGDRLPVQFSLPDGMDGYRAEVQPAVIEQVYGNEGVVDCLEGPEFFLLPAAQQQALRNGHIVFTINSSSNRMAYQLKGPLLSTEGAVNLLSSAVTVGTVQLLPNGRLLILMADAQATGGYPRILTVCSTALPALAQMRPGMQCRFNIVTVQEAEEKLAAFMQL